MPKNQSASRKISKLQLTVIILVLLAVIGAGAKWYIENSRGGLKQGVYSRKMGSPKAPLQVVEFADYQCPACAVGAKFLKDFMTKHPETVLLEMKFFPLGMHIHATTSAWYAECAARQGKFWPFQDLLFERQKEWTGLIDAKPAFNLIAKDVGLDQVALDVCLKDPAVNAVFIKEKNEGKSLGVVSTPTYFINNKMVVGHKNLEKELNQFLNAQKK